MFLGSKLKVPDQEAVTGYQLPVPINNNLFCISPEQVTGDPVISGNWYPVTGNQFTAQRGHSYQLINLTIITLATFSVHRHGPISYYR